jgi:signal transduction histidine kinase/GAF domain-containing protein
VVEVALRQDKFSGITEILASIATSTRSFGCVLWEAVPRSDATDKAQSFFGLAQWFQDGIQWLQHDIPVTSATGHAVEHRLPYYHITNLNSDAFAYRAPFVEEHGISTACIVPLTFLDGAAGSLNVYRRGEPREFAKEEIQDIWEVAQLLPQLYEAIRDEVGYRLSREVDSLLQENRLSKEGGSASRSLKDLMGDLCRLIATNLQCVDVSIFLEEPTRAGTHFRLAGSSSPEALAHTRNTYAVGSLDPTGYALTRRESIRLLALAGLRNSEESPYRDLEPPEPEYVAQMRLRGHGPASFMATPLLASGRLLGVIRCCAPVAGPLYFAGRESNLLRLLAGQIGRYISDFISRQDLIRENESWRAAVDNVSEIAAVLQKELKKTQPSEERINSNALDLVRKALPEAEFAYVFSASGAHGGWDLSAEGTWHKAKRLGGGLSPPDEWTRRLRKDEAVLLTQADLENVERRTLTYLTAGNITELILAPILCSDTINCLVIGNCQDAALPPYSLSVAKLLAKQLSVYHELASTIGQLRHMTQEKERLIEKEQKAAQAQQQTFRDLEHQLKTPLRHARTRIPVLLRLSDASETQAIHRQLLFLRGIIRRASRVAMSIGLFADLAAEKPLRIQKRSISGDLLNKTMIEAVMDHQLIFEHYEGRGVTFHVSSEDFQKLPSGFEVSADENLLHQVINNVLENAGKYSFDDERVLINCGLTKTRFYISVKNTGLRISSSEVDAVKQRGYRGSLAQASTGEGDGIGLWIVDNIMREHRGELKLFPTTADDVTEVRLYFPV